MSRGMNSSVLRLVHYTPIGAYEQKDAGRSALEALSRVVPRLLTPKTYTARIMAADIEKLPGVEALLFGLAEAREVHIVGGSWLARQMRDLLRAGRIPGWSLHELPETTTPVFALFPLLPAVTVTALEKCPFTTVEEVAAAPDEGLRELHRLGAKGVAAIRDACAHPAVREFTGRPAVFPDLADPPPFGHRMNLAHQIRYQGFLEGLLHRSFPQTAVNTIIRAIEAEPIPPADPLVVLLLETAGAMDLLAYYVSTHGPAAAQPEAPSDDTESLPPADSQG
ncbi:hypothetical protein AB1484_12485 [Parafrankia sp. FMc6]|uniref:hypothetical protein n=1 Tax=Parafrankia soli TaxID=2599596 RepID=UPI0034D51B9A